ncbi:MAG: S9 family peptidase, partial [Bacteroidaceae bacterium]|nr:S9 family peptidase [Bacteroidaceae bacterium]
MRLLQLTCVLILGLSSTVKAQNTELLPEYDQARKFTAQKLSAMLFDTYVDAHWMPDGQQFWYKYKTSQGTRWYIVNPSKHTKKPLFDNDKLAAQLTEITHDPMEGSHLSIHDLRANKEGLFTFYVRGSQDVKPDTADSRKPKKGKELFFFTYNPANQQLTRDTAKWKEDTYP